MATPNDSNHDSSDTKKKEPTVLRILSPLLSPWVHQSDDGPPKEEEPTQEVPRTALILLNTPIPLNDHPVLDRLWQMSKYRICADGGANRLYDTTVRDKTFPSPDNTMIPNCIVGDLDSLRPSVREYYQQAKVTIEQDPDQDTNDLDKALQKLVSVAASFDRILIYGAFGGRFDQEMASFQALYKWGRRTIMEDPRDGQDPEPPLLRMTPPPQLWLYNEETCAILIPSTMPSSDAVGSAPQPPSNKRPMVEIRLPYFGDKAQVQEQEQTQLPGRIGEGPTCGLIPLAAPCQSIVTTGFQWDLDESMPMEFGGLVSSSNRAMSSILTIQCSQPIIFTAEIVGRKEEVSIG